MPKYSIVIPSWFTASGQDGKYGKHETFSFAFQCMERLVSTLEGLDYELIVIDNGSSLDEMALRIQRAAFPLSFALNPIEKYWSNATVLVRNQKNLGFAPACNQGFKLATGEWFICMNNDILVWPGWLEQMEKSFLEIEHLSKSGELKDQVGVLMPALMKETGDAREALKIERPDLSRNYDKFGVGAEFGSLWMARKSFLDQLVQNDGYLYDEQFKMGMGEDRDLWDRVRMAGKETYRTHKIRVWHQGNMSWGKLEGHKEFSEKNREYLAEKRAKRV